MSTHHITVDTTVHVPLADVWRAWTPPADIRQWNAASDDWHTTATVDLLPGDAFSSRKKEIEANDETLNISRYVSTAEAEDEIGLAATLGELMQAEREIQQARDTHNVFLVELGLPPLP